jgi:hypothetical protein
MDAFQASPLYSYIMTYEGGPALNSATAVFAVQQGSSNIPANSAGGLGNSVVSVEILQAVMGIPDVLEGSSNSADYVKRFVSLGNGESSGSPPALFVDLPRVWSGGSGGYGGYDIAIIDLGKNLSAGSGKQNAEATVFQVELMAEGVIYDVGQINGSGGNFINVILLDVTGIPGIPPEVDGLRIVDVSGDGASEREALDVDGVLRLNADQPTQVSTLTTWGRIRALSR